MEQTQRARRHIVSISNVLWLVSGPIFVLSVSLFFTFPQILTATNPRTDIPSSGIFPHMRLDLIIDSCVEDLDKGYFTSECTMKLYLEENSTTKTSYNIMVIPMGYESALYGVHVPFENLEHEYPHYILNLLTKEWITCDRYSYSANLRMPIASTSPERFPGDFYMSSTIYVWFSGAFYPEVTLLPTSYAPRGFILSLSEPRLVNSTYFYLEILPTAHRLGVSMPSNEVLAFEIVIQRDERSLLVHVVYIIFLLCLTYEVLAISRLKIKQLNDRLKIFVGLAITSVAFLWSTHQVGSMLTWSEILLELILVFWLAFEVKDAVKVRATTNEGANRLKFE